jgi:putative transposase
MGSVGDCYDNALCESVFATLECEWLARHRWADPADARRGVFDFIEGWYNPKRRHSSIGYLSPVAFERAQEIAMITGGPGRTHSASLPA